MSGIVLSSSVRQNLLSLQSTADLLATTQNRLATGKKVNSALDNPTNFFTASSLDSRASDINNLLDGIGNGVQVLQAANTGITSLQKLVDSAKSVANQALQTTVGYSTKSSFTSVVIDGATADNLVADQDPTNAAFTGTAAPQRGAYVSTALTAGTQLSIAGPANASGYDAAVGPDHHQRPGDRCCRHADCQRQDDHLRSGREWPRRFGQRLYAGCQYHAERFGRGDRHPVGQRDPGQRVDGNGRHHHPEDRYGRRPRCVRLGTACSPRSASALPPPAPALAPVAP